MRFAIVTAGCVALLLGAGADAADVKSKIIEGDVYYRQPLAPCEVPSVVMWIARVTQIPGGIEWLPDDCLPVRRPAGSEIVREKVYLTGKRVGDALNELITVDPRYAWIESEGVVVVRPVTAWANQQHFLHRAIRPFVVSEQHVGVALDEWRRAIWSDIRPRSESLPLRAAQRTEEGNRPFTVTVARQTSGIGALEQIVRAHGKLVWEVQYCQPIAADRFATVYLWTAELDPTGIGATMPGRSQTVNGKTVDPCAAGSR